MHWHRSLVEHWLVSSECYLLVSLGIGKPVECKAKLFESLGQSFDV